MADPGFANVGERKIVLTLDPKMSTFSAFWALFLHFQINKAVISCLFESAKLEQFLRLYCASDLLETAFLMCCVS